MLSLCALMSLILCSTARAGMATFDVLTISTASGQADNSGITISSDAYILPGSSLTLQGAGGYITTQSSITASSFFGDGGHLTNVASLSGNNAFSGANTFTSSFTVQSSGRPISVSTGAGSNNIFISSNGSVSFNPRLHNSSATIVPEAQTTNSSFGPCIVSTITLTTSGGRVELIFTGSFKLGPDAASEQAAINFLQDGQFVRDLSNTKGFIVFTSGATLDSYTSMRLSYLLDAPAPGQHSYCLTISALNGLPTTLSAASSNIFYVKEIK